MLSVKALLLSLMLPYCYGYTTFQTEIPNGDQVPHPCKPNTNWLGVGHIAQQGGGSRNAFGRDFLASGKTWTVALCMLDSDGDGVTNGAELGDPGCSWTKGSTPSRTYGITHPGYKTPVSSHPYSSSDTSTLDCTPTPVDCPATRHPSVKTLNLTIAKGTAVPDDNSTLYCTAFHVPYDRAYHAIAFDPILNNTKVIHHMLLYACSNNVTGPPGECDMPGTHCRDLVAVWSLGQPGQCLPDVVGLRFGKGTYVTFQIQVHWNNPEGVSTFKDASGFRVFYTPRLRVHDLGIFRLGETNITIPGRRANTTVVSQCSSDCSRVLLTSPVKVLASFTHMHMLGRQSSIRHTSISTNITRQILFQDVYDYKSPEWTQHNPPVAVHPGDSTELLCTWDSIQRDDTTFYGDALTDEMCFGFLQYYPKLGDLHCTTLSGQSKCRVASTVCSDTGCPLSVFFSNVSAVFSKGLVACTASGVNGCNRGCRSMVEVLHAMRIDPCVATRHPTEFARLWSDIVSPYRAHLDALVYRCSGQHPDFGKTPLATAEINGSAEISSSCPSDENIIRYAPVTTTMSSGDVSPASYIAPSNLMWATLVLLSLLSSLTLFGQ